MTYAEMFPPGTRVRVSAGYGQGTDTLFSGRAGRVVGMQGNWVNIFFDRPMKSWPNPTTICGHNVRLQKAPKE